MIRNPEKWMTPRAHAMTDMPEKPEARIKPRDCQPSKAELEEEYDMPGASMEALRDAFFKPLKSEEKSG